MENNLKIIIRANQQDAAIILELITSGGCWLASWSVDTTTLFDTLKQNLSSELYTQLDTLMFEMPQG